MATPGTDDSNDSEEGKHLPVASAHLPQSFLGLLSEGWTHDWVFDIEVGELTRQEAIRFIGCVYGARRFFYE